MAKGSAIPGYDVLVLKRRGVTRDLPSGTESLQWVTNTATLIYGEHDAVVVDTFAIVYYEKEATYYSPFSSLLASHV
jgi:hypothetical protein